MKFLKITLLFIMMSTGSVFAQTVDFTGSWAINKSKTDFGKAPESALPKAYTVTQQKNQITIQRTTLDAASAEHTASEVLNFDGTPTASTLGSGVKRTVSLKWNDYQQSFVIAASSVTPDGQPGGKISDTWSLADGGKTLVLNRHVEQADGFAYDIKGFYDKQQ